MRKAFIVLSIGAVLLVGGLAANPGARTRWYFATERQWAAHWPLPRGGSLPQYFKPLVRPTAAAWVDVEPSVTMLLDPEDYISNEILRTGEWERESWDAIRRHLAPGAVFIDVGAHIGYYSLKAAAVVGSTGRIVSVEPNPPTVQRLRDNVAASGASVVHVQPVACSDHESTLDFFAAPRANTGQSSLSAANAAQEGGVAASYRVPARPLDAIVADERLTRLDVVKIDVEGAEMLVLKGATATIDRFHPALIIELIESQLRQMGSSVEDVRAFMRAHGYEPRGEFKQNVEFEWKKDLARVAD